MRKKGIFFLTLHPICASQLQFLTLFLLRRKLGHTCYIRFELRDIRLKDTIANFNRILLSMMCNLQPILDLIDLITNSLVVSSLSLTTQAVNLLILFCFQKRPRLSRINPELHITLIQLYVRASLLLPCLFLQETLISLMWFSSSTDILIIVLRQVLYKDEESCATYFVFPHIRSRILKTLTKIFHTYTRALFFDFDIFFMI